jgi:hypothetical protein
MLLTAYDEKMRQAGGDGGWRRAGEGINEARDRLRAEREAAKERLRAKGVEV